MTDQTMGTSENYLENSSWEKDTYMTTHSIGMSKELTQTHSSKRLEKNQMMEKMTKKNKRKTLKISSFDIFSFHVKLLLININFCEIVISRHKN